MTSVQPIKSNICIIILKIWNQISFGLNFNLLRFTVMSIDIENKSHHWLVIYHNPFRFNLNIWNLECNNTFRLRHGKKLEMLSNCMYKFMIQHFIPCLDFRIFHKGSRIGYTCRYSYWQNRYCFIFAVMNTLNTDNPRSQTGLYY